jgi:hypothetical protein
VFDAEARSPCLVLTVTGLEGATSLSLSGADFTCLPLASWPASSQSSSRKFPGSFLLRRETEEAGGAGNCRKLQLF